MNKLSKVALALGFSWEPAASAEPLTPSANIYLGWTVIICCLSIKDKR